jgi:hypothetical protein
MERGTRTNRSVADSYGTQPFVKMGRLIQNCINTIKFPEETTDAMFNPWLV